MSTDLLGHQGGVYYFDVGGRRVAVSAVEAQTAKVADADLVDDATLEDRARYLAQEKARSLPRRAQ